MEQLAKKKGVSPDVVERFGTVVAIGGDTWIVRAEGDIEVKAHRAVGCLVRPEAGDKVLVAWGGSDARAYVLNVLERASDGRLEIGCDGEATLRASHLLIATEEGVAVTTPSAVEITAKTIGLRSDETSLVTGKLEWIARTLEGQATRVRTIAESVETFVETATERVKRAFRFVEEVDVKRAGRIDHAATETYSLRARDAMMQVEQLIKIDGEQVHLG